MKKRLVAFFAVMTTIAVPALAEPAIGLGVSFSFGGAGGTETGLGARLFSDNDHGRVVAAAGVDYMLSSRRVRPTMGAAYLGRNNYIGAELGFGLSGEGVDFGLSLGGVDTK